MSETQNNSYSYGHAQRNLQQSIGLSNHLYLRDGKVTEDGRIWLKQALAKSGRDLIDRLGPEMQVAAKEILNQEQEKKL